MTLLKTVFALYFILTCTAVYNQDRAGPEAIRKTVVASMPILWCNVEH